MASIWDKFKNATPFDELANAGVATARGIGNVAGQGAYGLGRAAGTGVNLYGQALGRMAGMGMDAAGMGINAAQGLGRYGMQGAQALGSAELENLRRQASMVGNVAQGVGGAAMGAGRGFMEGVRGPEAGMGKSMGMIGTLGTNQRVGRRPGDMYDILNGIGTFRGLTNPSNLLDGARPSGGMMGGGIMQGTLQDRLVGKQDRDEASRMLGVDVMDAIRRMGTRNQQMPMPVVRNSYGAPGRYGG